MRDLETRYEARGILNGAPTRRGVVRARGSLANEPETWGLPRIELLLPKSKRDTCACRRGVYELCTGLTTLLG
jgi:hypothetical protein